MAIAHYLTFSVFALIAVAGALGMTTTMSMFRSAIFLMASFIGVGGLFVLLMADLLGLLQVMMYIGGMLVMALFMVLFSGDPGGKMMTGMMDLPLVERFFSSGLVHASEGDDERGDEDDDGGHDMQMEPMFIVQHKTPAAILAALVWGVLSALVVFSPAWATERGVPNQHSAERIGHLLMSKYMVAFEGAALMILLGIFGAVYLARPGRYPDPTERDAIRAAVDETPAPIAEDLEADEDDQEEPA